MKTINPLIEYVKKAGDIAVKRQFEVDRSFKEDGSVVTKIDKELNKYLSDAILSLYPEANLITEEADSSYDSSKEFSFAVDPIDGTDAFSQMMPGWCLSVGLLKGGEPVAGIVYAPLWGASGGNFLFCDIEGAVTVNGEVFDSETLKNKEKEELQIMVGSKLHRKFTFSGFKGKIRSSGSSVICIIAPLLHSAISGSLINPCSIWDIAAAHAIIKRTGLDFSYFSGKEVDYSEIFNRSKCRDHIVSGCDFICRNVRENFLKKNAETVEK